MWRKGVPSSQRRIRARVPERGARFSPYNVLTFICWLPLLFLLLGGGDGGVVYTLRAIPVTLSSTSSCLNLSVPIQHSNLL